MNKLLRLKNEALEACKFREHDMGDFQFPYGRPDTCYSHCKTCDMQVIINLNTMLNEIDIGGEAVALDCGKEKQNASNS